MVTLTEAIEQARSALDNPYQSYEMLTRNQPPTVMVSGDVFAVLADAAGEFLVFAENARTREPWVAMKVGVSPSVLRRLIDTAEKVAP